MATTKQLREEMVRALSEMEGINKKAVKTNADFAAFDDAHFRFKQANTEFSFRQAQEGFGLLEGDGGYTALTAESSFPGRAAKARQARAKESLGKAVGMLLNGKVTKVNEDLIKEIGGQDAREQRTTYPDDQIIQTSVSDDVLFELTTDGNFLEEVQRVNVMGGYLRTPKIERGNYPVAETKAMDAALSGTDLTFTSDLHQPHNIYAHTRYHKDLIRDNFGAASYIWNATRTGVTKKLHQLCLYGNDSTAGQFDGFDNISGVQTVDAGSVALSSYDKISEGVKKLLDKYVRLENIIGVMNPVAWLQLAKLFEAGAGYIDGPTAISQVRMMTNPEVLTTYATNTETRIYLFDPKQVILSLFGQFEITLNERYAEYDHAAAMFVFRCDFKVPDVETVCIVTDIANS